MKKIYLSFLSMAVCSVMSAQVDVTLNVDLNSQTVSGDGVHVAGNFGDITSGQPTWDPAGIELTDGDADGIYSVTLPLLPGAYQFKFVNGNAWGSDEGGAIPQACRAPGSDNRELIVTETAIERTFVWQGCGPEGENVVRFRVDMSTQPAVNPVGVHVAGDFQDADGGAEWQSGDNPLYDLDGNDVWEAYYSIGEATTVVFKYINGNDWSNPNESISGACGNSEGNRVENVTEINTALPVYCFSQCDPCTQPAQVTTQPAQVTFAVDMSLQTVSANGVHMAGNFASAGYSDWDPAGIELLDGDGDDIYEVTLALPNGSYQYKYVNGNAWGSDESVPGECAVGGNRGLTIESSDPVTAQNCFLQCNEACIADPTPADITFSVNMSNVTISPDGPRVIGSFTTPTWQDGQVAWQDGQVVLQESAVAGIWYATVTVSGSASVLYKFVNGIASSSDESNAESNIAACGVDNGIGGYNRSHIRSGVAETLTTPCFDTCDICGTLISVEEQEVVNGLLVYPNPIEDLILTRLKI